MTLYELKQVFKNGVDTTDKEWDCIIYVSMSSVNDEIAKKINVIDYEQERIAPLQLDYVGFIKNNRHLINTYLKECYTKQYASEIINLNDDELCEEVLCESDIMHGLINDEYDLLKNVLKSF